MKKFISIKLFLVLITVLLSNSPAFANNSNNCENMPLTFDPLAQLIKANLTIPPKEKLCRHLHKAKTYAKRGKDTSAVRQLKIIIRITRQNLPMQPWDKTPISLETGALFTAEAQRLVDLLQASNVVLPPDPGEAGKATIEGIDSDGDGLRDDVQRFIAFKYPNSELTRVMLSVRAKALQAKIVDANDEALSIQHAQDSMMMGNCSAHVAWKKNIGIRDWFVIEREMRAEVINTDARIRNYIIYNGQGGRRSYTAGAQRGPEAAKMHCPFDPDIIPN